MKQKFFDLFTKIFGNTPEASDGITPPTKNINDDTIWEDAYIDDLFSSANVNLGSQK